MSVLSRPAWAGDWSMKRIRDTAEQLICKLKTAEQLIAQGKSVSEDCRVIEVTQPTYHRWRQQYGVTGLFTPLSCGPWPLVRAQSG